MQATNKSAETDARIAVRNAGAELYKSDTEDADALECYNKAAEAVHTGCNIRPWPLALGQRAIRSRLRSCMALQLRSSPMPSGMRRHLILPKT